MDILPLLLVKAHARNFTWHVGRHFTLNLYTRGFGLQGVGNTLRKILEEAPRRLLGDVRSGVFSELCLRRIVYSPPDWSSWEWRIIVRKKNGGLNQQEKDNMAMYCDMLVSASNIPTRTASRLSHQAVVNIEVKNAEGCVVEAYRYTMARGQLALVGRSSKAVGRKK